ncbi:DUF2191 domain-containing protein [Streptomyces sp. NPDC059534]|uniref:DUF2191 domain-containing protein n=1 Tax=Streptomyces sp. NPDC059534 TaxID=3346859 RepID=UPI00368A2744
MSKILVDIDDEMLALAQRRLGTTTTQGTIDRALAVAASISADDRARSLRWLQRNAEGFLDFDFLASR